MRTIRRSSAAHDAEEGSSFADRNGVTTLRRRGVDAAPASVRGFDGLVERVAELAPTEEAKDAKGRKGQASPLRERGRAPPLAV